MEKSTITVSVIFSFFNEEKNLPELIRRVRAVLQKEYPQSYELIFVNDDSKDRSEEILIDAAKDNNDIKIITTSRTFGGSQCALLGMKYSSGDAVIYMDSDLQDPPEVIAELLKAWREGEEIDVVHTVRLSRSGENRIRLAIIKLGYYILKAVSNIEIHIEAGDFKLLSRRAIKHVIRLKEKRPFMRGLVNWIGFNQTKIYYHRDARYAGKSNFPLFKPQVIQNFLGSALISFSDLPLQIFIITGFLTALGSFLYIGYLILQYLIGNTIPVWSPLMVTVLFLGGMNLLGIGILGLYISSIYLETKGRPNYIIKKTFGFEQRHEKTDL